MKPAGRPGGGYTKEEADRIRETIDTKQEKI